MAAAFACLFEVRVLGDCIIYCDACALVHVFFKFISAFDLIKKHKFYCRRTLAEMRAATLLVALVLHIAAGAVAVAQSSGSDYALAAQLLRDSLNTSVSGARRFEDYLRLKTFQFSG